MRGAHRAFFLDDEEKTCVVELLRDHHGTMFEGRYHERNHKPEKPVMWRTAAYVDINVWSAGIVKKAKNYEAVEARCRTRTRQT